MCLALKDLSSEEPCWKGVDFPLINIAGHVSDGTVEGTKCRHINGYAELYPNLFRMFPCRKLALCFPLFSEEKSTFAYFAPPPPRPGTTKRESDFGTHRAEVFPLPFPSPPLATRHQTQHCVPRPMEKERVWERKEEEWGNNSRLISGA